MAELTGKYAKLRDDLKIALLAGKSAERANPEGRRQKKPEATALSGNRLVYQENLCFLLLLEGRETQELETRKRSRIC